jgi:hypothetical protein
VTTAKTWTEMADAIHRHLPGTTVDAVATAIEEAGLTQGGLARFVNRLQGPTHGIGELVLCGRVWRRVRECLV